MKIIKRVFGVAITCCLILCLSATPVYARENVKRVVKKAKKIYYGLNEQIQKEEIEDCGIEGVYQEYVIDGMIRKTVMYPGNGDMDVRGYTVEYYYDSLERLIFSFAYKKTNGKVKEYRAYYSTNGKCYRTINTKGKKKDYKNGSKGTSSETLPMYAELYNKGTWNIAVAHGG